MSVKRAILRVAANNPQFRRALISEMQKQAFRPTVKRVVWDHKYNRAQWLVSEDGEGWRSVPQSKWKRGYRNVKDLTDTKSYNAVHEKILEKMTKKLPMGASIEFNEWVKTKRPDVDQKIEWVKSRI
jgi:hypothetical protein